MKRRLIEWRYAFWWWVLRKSGLADVLSSYIRVHLEVRGRMQAAPGPVKELLPACTPMTKAEAEFLSGTDVARVGKDLYSIVNDRYVREA